ncbi:MAG TPA: hypothetical protein ENJ23_05445 [Bacteroidetes bacterium]|nr:hypothetical protein [Bacteroidota bacterium]
MFVSGKKFYAFIFFGLILCWTSVAWPQAKRQERSRLQKIRAEIQRYRKMWAQQSRKEQTTLEQLSRIDREIDLLQSLIRELRKKEARLKANVFSTNADLLQLQEEFEKQREAYAARLVHFYKHRNLDNLEILLSVRSLSQALVWAKYMRRISEADQRRLRKIQETKTALEALNRRYRRQLADLNAVLKEKATEEKTLQKRRKSRRKLLAKIRSDKKLYAQKIAEYEQAAKEIERLIRSREKERLKRPLNLERVSQFPRLKGKMIWPTRGKVIRRFGKVKNPGLNTYYINEGIDIKAPMGADVRSTCSGVITAITWQRGRGNIVIVNHFGGYYTVYTHLSQILVTIGQEVKTGEVIGKVGDTGSLSGPVLHFEIWKEKTPVNPLRWLRRTS